EKMREVMARLRDLPPEERKLKRQAFKNATPQQRAAMLRELGIQPLPWQNGPLGVFAELKFNNGNECVEALASRFLVVSIDPDQRKVLLSALGVSDPAAPLQPQAIPPQNRRAALHLLTSMAEYQLC